MIGGRTAVYGLLGRPIRRSLSPRIHNRWFAELDLDAVYVPFEVPTGQVPDPVGVMRQLGLSGLNLTVPFKGLAVDRCDRLGPVAQVAAAINVLVRRGETVEGHNTDAEGFVDAFEASQGKVAGRRALVVGAGGAGRAVAAGLCDRGARSVVLANRTEAAATEAVARMAARWPAVALHAAPLEALALDGTDIVVVATGGQVDVGRIVDPHALADDAVWCDLNYWMAEPPGLVAARSRGLAVLDGLGMLVHQAARAFELWTDTRPDAAATHAWLRRRADSPGSA